MSCFQLLLDEVNGIPEYLEATSKLIGDCTSLRHAQAESVAVKLKNLGQLDVDVATRLKDALSAVSFDPADSVSLSGLIDNIVGDSAPTTTKANRRCSQRCLTWELYPPEKVWSVLSDKDTPWSVKYIMIKDFSAELGLVLPSEPTRGRILESLLLANGLPIVRDKEFYHKLVRLSETLAPLQQRKCKMAHLEQFPTSPKD